MYAHARKIDLIEAVLKISNEAILVELESVLKRKPAPKNKKAISAHDFSGIWSEKDALLIENAIVSACEQIHEDDWK
jgi:hypothetical protein